MKLSVFLISTINILLIQTLSLLAQDTLEVKTKSTFSTKNLFMRYTVPYSPITDTAGIKGAPLCDQFEIGRSIINKYQYWYSAYKAGKRDVSKFLSEVKAFNIDTNSLSTDQIKSYVNIFSGLRGKQKIIIVDANNNNDFSDDTSYEYDTLSAEKWFREDTLELAPLIKIRYETFANRGVQAEYTYIRLKPYDGAYRYPKDLQRRLTCYTVPYVHREGTFEVNGTEFKVSLSPSPQGHIDDYRTPYVKIQRSGYEYSREARTSVNEVVVVDNHVFRVLSCTMDGSVLKVAYEGYQKNREGGMLDNKIPTLTGKSLINDDIISVNKLVSDGNYVLLDFWGSWCAPCIRSMPDLKLLADRVKAGKVKLVGVDYEYTSNGQQSAKEYLAKNKINWRQVAELSTAQTDKSFPAGMSVRNYPTFILINPDGKVIAREIGEDGLLRIESQLEKLGLLNKLY